MADFFNDDTAVMTCVEERVHRSLPIFEMLRSSSHPYFLEVLKKAIVESGILADDVDKVPGLKSAYRLGLLQAECVEGGETLYSFPSSLHERLVISP